MTQIAYRANLNDAEFPFVSSFQGKTVIQGTIDQNYAKNIFDPQAGDSGIPEAYYMHNVLPSVHGYKSVAYESALAAIPGETDITRVFVLKDFSGKRGHLAVTSTGKTYISTVDYPVWLDITPYGQPANCIVTSADASGTSFICYDSFGIFEVDIANRTLLAPAFQFDSPLTSANMKGITASNNYLLCHDGSTLYWSSALSVLDFRASQITGAGNGVPTSARGSIITLSAVGIGFAVYCQGNIVVATFSGNVQYPWIFKEAPNGAGTITPYHVSNTGDEASNYAWTTGGILRVTLGGCTPVHPSASDFLSGRIFEDFNSSTDIFSQEYLTSTLNIRLAYLGSRYLAISYGKTELTHAILYDAALKRWGKLKVTHTQLFDVAYDIILDSIYLPYADLGLDTYESYLGISFQDMKVSTASDAAAAKHSIAVIKNDGSVSMVNADFGLFNSDSVLLLGKYQIYRLNTLAIQEFSLETIDASNNQFSVKVLTSLDGKNPDLIITPYETINPGIRQYKCLAVGTNHSLLIKGGFHLAALVMIFNKFANR